MGFDRALFEHLYNIEDRHFWSRAHSRVINELTRQIAAELPPGYRVLEVGCGTGNVLRGLERTCAHGTVTGMDPFAESLVYARRRTSCHLVQGDVYNLPFRQGFDLIGVFDVLEHLSDDSGALRNLRNLLSPGGTLLVTVPARQMLWSYYDIAMHHHRRYELPELRAKLVGAGYQIEYLTYYMVSMLPLIWVGRRVAALIGRRPITRANRARALAARELWIIVGVNALMAALLAPELRVISRRGTLPNGSSLPAVCRKG